LAKPESGRGRSEGVEKSVLFRIPQKWAKILQKHKAQQTEGHRRAKSCRCRPIARHGPTYQERDVCAEYAVQNTVLPNGNIVLFSDYTKSVKIFAETQDQRINIGQFGWVEEGIGREFHPPHND